MRAAPCRRARAGTCSRRPRTRISSRRCGRWRRGTYLDPALGGRLLAAPEGTRGALTDREREVLRLIALEHTNAAMAELLYLSVRTVETHRANIHPQARHGQSRVARPAALERGLVRP